MFLLARLLGTTYTLRLKRVTISRAETAELKFAKRHNFLFNFRFYNFQATKALLGLGSGRGAPEHWGAGAGAGWCGGVGPWGWRQPVRHLERRGAAQAVAQARPPWSRGQGAARQSLGRAAAVAGTGWEAGPSGGAGQGVAGPLLPL